MSMGLCPTRASRAREPRYQKGEKYKTQTDPHGKAIKKKSKNKTKNYIFKHFVQYFGLKTNLLQGAKRKMEIKINVRHK